MIILNPDNLRVVRKDQILDLSKTLTAIDIHFLIEELSEKDDKLRYNAFLLLQSYSRLFSSVYEYWGELEKKIDSDNSYQRSLGIMLIAENVRWDKEGKFSETIGKYLRCCNDEKFITARQTIQGLETIVKTTDKFDKEIKQGILSLQFSGYKENQRKLLKKDTSNLLKAIETRSVMDR
jgi:hypothetical protein